MAETFEYMGPLTEPETFEPIAPAAELNYAQRVGARLAAVPGTIAKGVTEGIPELVTGGGEGRFQGGMKALGALGAMMEPLLAPVGEAGRSGAEFLARQVPEETYPQPRSMSEEDRVSFVGGVGALASEAAVGLGRPVANLAAKAGLSIPLMSKRVTPIGQKMVDLMGYEGTRAAQATQSRLLDFLDNVASSSILGGQRVAKMEARQTNTMQSIADDFAAMLGKQVKDPQMRGTIIKSIADQEDTAWRAAGNQLFKQVDQIHPNPAVDMSPVYDVVRKLQAEFPEGTEAGNLLRTIGAQIKPSVSQTQHPLGNILGPLGTPMMTSTTTTTPAVKTFLESNDLRSWAYAWKTPGLSAAGDQAARVGSLVGKALDDAIDLAGLTVNPAARRQLQVARDFWKSEATPFNRRAVRRMLHDGNLPPEKVVDTFLKPGALTEIQGLRKMVGGPDSQAWGTVRRSFVEDMLDKAQKIDTNLGKVAMDGPALHTQLMRWGDTTKEILGADQAGLFKDIAEVIAQAQSKLGGGGGVMIQLQQSGAIIKSAQLIAGVGGYATGQVGGEAALGIILGPAVLARILTNPTMTRALLEGLRARPGSAGAVRYSATLANFIQPGRRASEEPKSAELEKMFFGRGAK